MYEHDLNLLVGLWPESAPSVKAAWVLLAVSAVVLVLGEFAHRRRIGSRIAWRRVAVLAARALVAFATACCLTGVGMAVILSGHDIDTPRLILVEQMVVTQARAFLILCSFAPIAAIVLIVSFVVEGLGNWKRE